MVDSVGSRIGGNGRRNAPGAIGRAGSQGQAGRKRSPSSALGKIKIPKRKLGTPGLRSDDDSPVVRGLSSTRNTRSSRKRSRLIPATGSGPIETYKERVDREAKEAFARTPEGKAQAKEEARKAKAKERTSRPRGRRARGSK